MTYKLPLIEDLSLELIQDTIRKTRIENYQSIFALREKLKDFYFLDQTSFEYLYRYGFIDRKTRDILQHLPPISTGLTRRIIKRISTVYKKPPERKLLNNRGAVYNDDDYNRFISDNPEFNVALKEIERYYNLLDNVLLRFVYDYEGKKFLFFIETDYLPYFESKNPLKPVGYDIYINTRDDIKTWLFISDDYYFYHDENGKMWNDPNLPDKINPYSRMPLVDFSTFAIEDYWGFGKKDIVEANQMLNIMLLTGMYGFQFQSFDQPYMTGVDGTDVDKLQFGPTRVPTLPEGATMGLLGYSPDFAGMSTWLKFYINSVLQNYGILVNWEETGSAQSGISLKIKNLELLENREDAIDFFRQKEREIFDVLKVMLNYHAEINYRIPDDARLRVDYSEISFPKDPAEVRAEWQWKWENGLATKIDYLMCENPDLSAEEAEKKYEENIIKNRKLRGLGTPGATEEVITGLIR